MRLIPMRSAIPILPALLLAACSGADRARGGEDVRMQVMTSLPPGQSGYFSTEGQALGMVTGNPADYGEHIDDQRLMHWSSQFKDGRFQDIRGRQPDLSPREGVSIYFDAFGVPAVYAESVEDLWYGAGYVMAQQRLFLMDGVRREARGTLAELTGPNTVPQDIKTRVLTYSEAEYQAMFEGLSETARQSISGYVAGVNDRIAEVLADPTLLPAEYGLLSSLPEPLSITDVVAAGVLMTRFVAAEGGNEMENVIALKQLQEMHGEQKGRRIFRDLFWVDDPKAAVTIPPGEGRFSNITTPPGERLAVFEAQADFAIGLPDELLRGPGTGDAPAPAAPLLGKALRHPAAQAARYLQAFLGNLHGGSYMVVLRGDKTANGLPLMYNGPQLEYTYPSTLVELEVHGAGFHARGATVPGLPVVGIGNGKRIAWGLTTGYSKTIDSFIEDTSVGDGPNQYRHAGTVKDMDCRTETVSYRQAPDGVPAGPPVFSEEVEVCRTVHGPVVARSGDGSLARSVQYAMWGREVDTIEGIIAWQQADNLAEFRQAMELVTWNENTMYVDADGNIAYFHPGLHALRHPSTDLRLPNRGTGEQDHLGFMAFEDLPQSINPAQGWLANWNNKPALGWGDGIGGNAITRPSAPVQRVVNWQRLLAAENGIDLQRLIELDRQAGRIDVRAQAWQPLIRQALGSGVLGEQEAALASLLAAWDGLHYNPEIDIEDEGALDRPAETVFDVFVRAMRQQMFGDVLPEALFERMSDVGNHEYDASPLDNLVLKVLNPGISGIPLLEDYSQGLQPAAWIQQGLLLARVILEAEYGSSDLQDFRRVHHRDSVCSLTGGVIGPCLTMPHQDRGTWNEIIGFDFAAP